jgi:glycosyltransferase involved in cell wall biosynthesis
MRKKIILKAPLLTRSGYGEQSRYALRALRSREDLFDIYIQPLQWGQTSWISTMNEERAWIDQAIEKTIGFVQQGGQFDMSLQVTIPNEFERIASVNIGYTAGIETTRVAHQWISKGNEMDKILVISSHSKNTFEQTVYEGVNEQTGESVHLRLNTPIEVINYPVKFHDDLPDLQLKFDYDCNFLTIAQFGPRKNLPNTIKWFVEEFENEEVGLIVKSNIAKNCLMDREKLYNDLQGFLKNFPNRKCKVYLLHGDMTDEEIHSLYVHPQIKALVALPHGEGFGLPIFEAAYSGLPVVATGWSGQLDYLVDEQGKEQFYNVAFDLQQVQDQVVWDGVIIKESMWAFPREQSAKEQLRAAYNDRDSEPRTPPCIRERFEPTKMYDKFVNFLVSDTTTADDPDAWMREIDSIVKEYE